MSIKSALLDARSWRKSLGAFIVRLTPAQLFGLMFALGLVIGIPLAAALNWYSLSH